MNLLLPVAAPAQDRAATLADIRQQIATLEVELDRLRRELVTTGSGMEAPDADQGPLARLDAIEGELRRLTAATEELENRIERVARDGTNRIDDLKFRLTELEGGAVSDIPATPPLGGDGPRPSDPLPPPAGGGGGDGPQLAEGEQGDFDAAMALMEEGTPADAYAALTEFVETYPRSPLAPHAEMARGDALVALGNRAQAGRAYLEAYTLAETADPGLAARALVKLGRTLADLDQTREACVTLGEVPSRFPDTEAAGQAEAALAEISCP